MDNQIVEVETLENIAHDIEQCADKADENRVELAILICKARTLVNSGEAGKITWRAWVQANLTLKLSRVRELERIGDAEDPRAALAQQRRANKVRQERHRAKQQDAAPLRNGAVDNGMAEVAVAEPMAVPAAEPRFAVVSSTEPEPARERLRRWVDAASLEDVERALNYVDGLAAAVAA